MYGSILAVLILLLFLRNVRTTMIIAITIPISVIATFGLMFFYGFTLNTVTFGGLARIMQEIRIRVDWGPEKMP